MASGALVLVAFPALLLAFQEVPGLLLALLPLAVAIVGWLGARSGKPAWMFSSAVALAAYIALLMQMMDGMLPFLFMPGTLAMFMAANLMRGRGARTAAR